MSVPVKRQFGGWLSRTLRGGASLSSLEHDLLVALVDALPAPMRATVLAQFASYNLVQREIDGRALNFYRVRGLRSIDRAGVPLLETSRVEAPLMRISVSIDREREPIHAVLTAVEGRAFSISFSRRIPQNGANKISEINRIEQAWRSDVSNVRSSA